MKFMASQGGFESSKHVMINVHIQELRGHSGRWEGDPGHPRNAL